MDNLSAVGSVASAKGPGELYLIVRKTVFFEYLTFK